MVARSLYRAFFAGLLFSFLASFDSALAEDKEKQPVLAVVFRIADLPVWRLDDEGTPRFDASILISQIKNQVEPDSWSNEAVSIGQDKKGKAIVVAQTSDVIEKIGQFLARQRAFVDHDVEKRLKKNLEVAAISTQQVLLFVSGADSKSADEFFEARYEQHKPRLQAAFSNYVIQCMTPMHARQLDDKEISLPKENTATFVIIRADGSIVAEADFKRFRSSGVFDPQLLSRFLENHSEKMPDAKSKLESAIAQAAKENKRLLAQMSGPGCGPCVRLSRYLASQSGVIAKDYMYVKLDNRMANADDVTNSLVDGLNRVPWMAILSNKGDILATSLSDEGNIAFPRSEAAKKHFQEMISSTSRHLSSTEILKLIDDLKDWQ